MVWFKVDDKMHSHRKTRRLLRSGAKKRRDVAPLGLWTAAGSWSADNLTDGFIPADELDTWDDDALTLAARLVDAGLWLEDSIDGEPGFRFKDWGIRNPDAASILAKREKESEGGRLGNHVRWHKNGIVVTECEFCTTTKPSGTRSGTPSGSDQGTRIGGESSRPVPSRPAAAAAADARDAAAAAELPGPVAVFRSKLQSHTALSALRFDTLTSDQINQLNELITLHGDDRLVTVARDTCRNPAPTHVSAFLGTWAALPPPGARLHAVKPRMCSTHPWIQLTDGGTCNGCASDQIASDR